MPIHLPSNMTQLIYPLVSSSTAWKTQILVQLFLHYIPHTHIKIIKTSISRVCVLDFSVLSNVSFPKLHGNPGDFPLFFSARRRGYSLERTGQRPGWLYHRGLAFYRSDFIRSTKSDADGKIHGPLFIGKK